MASNISIWGGKGKKKKGKREGYERESKLMRSYSKVSDSRCSEMKEGRFSSSRIRRRKKSRRSGSKKEKKRKAGKLRERVKVVDPSNATRGEKGKFKKEDRWLFRVTKEKIKKGRMGPTASPPRKREKRSSFRKR